MTNSVFAARLGCGDDGRRLGQKHVMIGLRKEEVFMARRVHFIFDYQRDLWRVNQICNIPNIIRCAAAGFHDSSLWEEARRKGDAAIKILIDNGLENTSVSVVCIGSMTFNRPYVNYEIRKSIERNNGILGIFINHLKDHNQRTSSRGLVPTFLVQPNQRRYEIYYYTNVSDLAEWIEVAAARADKYKKFNQPLTERD